MQTLLEDLRHGARMLMKRPGFAAIAIITLALGIGANTVIFSGVYANLLQSLPYKNSDRLTALSRINKQGIESGVSYPDFVEWKEQGTVFEQVSAFKNINVNLTGNETQERAADSLVSQDFFSMLGGAAILGRTFLEDDFHAESAKTIILSYRFWQSRFGGDGNIIGKWLKLDGQSLEVIGVMPPEFQYPFRAEFWSPLSRMVDANELRDRSASSFEIIAALKPSVAVDQAAKEMAALSERLAEQNAVANGDAWVKVTSLGDTLPGIVKYRTPILVLQLAVVFVLLIACANIANLLLAQATERRQEFTIRLSLGASRSRIIRQLLTENLLVAFLGGAFGLLVAMWGIDTLRARIPFRIPGVSEVEINGPVLLFTLAVSLVASFGFGIAPAFMASRQNLSEGLKAGAGSITSDHRHRRLSGALAVAEVALAALLLAASGLMIRTFLNLTNEDPGFDPRNRIALTLSLSQSEYPNYESLASNYEQLIKQIKAVPGVESAGAVTYLPLIGYNPGTGFRVEGQTGTDAQPAPRADFQPVTPDYFQAMGIPFLRGRRLTGADMKPTPEAVLINNAMAQRFFPGEDPVGKHIRLEGGNASTSSLVIAGVVGDVKQFGLHTEPRPEIYLPMYRHSMTLIIRADANSAGVIAAIRETTQSMRGDIVFNLKTMEQVVIDSIEKRRIFAFLLSVFSAVALAMATMGIYSVISYLVSQRTREIGIRIALGAKETDVMKMILRRAVALAASGVATGLAAALALNRVLGSLLFGVSATDLPTLMSVLAVLAAVALAASIIPARRAMKIDPVVALRHE